VHRSHEQHVSLELRPKTSKTVSSAYKRGKTVPNGENRRAAMFVDEDHDALFRKFFPGSTEAYLFPAAIINLSRMLMSFYL